MENVMEPRSGSFMADAESGQSGNKKSFINNIMGGAIIALILSVGGCIAYQNYQVSMAINVLNLIAQDIEAQKKT